MSKRAWVITAVVVVLAAVGGAGWFYAPQLYNRFFSPLTPAGRIAGVEKVDSFGPDGAGNLTIGRGMSMRFINGGSPELQAEAGYQLWLVRFNPMAGKPDEGSRRAFLVDDSGEKHSAAWMQVDEEGGSSKTALVFCLPEARTPQTIQFGDAPPVPLPAPR
ncbi:MAG: hypothetical protein ACRD4U_01680 [Candidatus Acidiferrales bacterium]